MNSFRASPAMHTPSGTPAASSRAVVDFPTPAGPFTTTTTGAAQAHTRHRQSPDSTPRYSGRRVAGWPGGPTGGDSGGG